MRSWYEIKAKADSAEVFIYDEIGGWGIGAKQFIDELKKLDGKSINLRIHSPGGSVLDGHAIYNALKRHDGGVAVSIDGLAASMASVIALAGDSVSMADNGFFMIHNPTGVSFGESEDMRKAADLLDKMRDGLVNIYAAKATRSKGEIEKMMEEETWLTAKEAKEMGFVDEITDEIPMAARFDLSMFSRAPKAILKVDNQTNTKPMTTLEVPIAELTQLRAESAALKDITAQLAIANAERDVFKAELAKANVTIADKDKAFAALTVENTKLQADLASLPEKINAEAQRTLASAGHPKPIAVDKPVENTGNLSDQLAAIKDPNERTRFYRENKAKLMALRK